MSVLACVRRACVRACVCVCGSLPDSDSHEMPRASN